MLDDRMITFDEAKQIVADHLKVSMPRYAADVVIVDEQTITKPYGWIFSYNTRQFLAGETKRGLIGNGGVLVERATGRCVQFGTAAPKEYYIQRYEAEHGGKPSA